jgi:C4-dicarboxylate-specific signal transduction histidine kinase
VSWAVCWVGWAFALAAGWTLRRRMTRLADAEHELRGALTAIGLAGEVSPAMRLQLDRMGAALADLAAARGACAPPASELEAGRLAQVLGNVIANAAEHGAGPVEVRAMRLELRNRDRPGDAARRTGRGRGVVIAKRAAHELGGRVSVVSEGGFTRTVVELPGPAEPRSQERQDRAA